MHQAFAPCSSRRSSTGLISSNYSYQKLLLLTPVEKLCTMDNLSYSSEEKMSGSSEKCKDGTWHLEMRKESERFQKKLHFTFGKSKNNKK
jgi:hypothetical protein